MHIRTDSGLTSVLSRTRTEPRTQASVVDAWMDASRAWPDVAGFVAGALLRSLDGERVLAYLQCTRPTAERDLASASLTPRLDGVAGATDVQTYDVMALRAPPQVSASALVIAPDDGLTTLINVFETDPSRQQELLDTWLTVGEPFTHHPGFVRAALHRSTDGTRVVNYAHWRSVADWQDLVAEHGRDFGRFRPLGQSDPHLYDVVHLVEEARHAPQRV